MSNNSVYTTNFNCLTPNGECTGVREILIGGLRADLVNGISQKTHKVNIVSGDKPQNKRVIDVDSLTPNGHKGQVEVHLGFSKSATMRNSTAKADKQTKGNFGRHQ